MTPYFSSPDRQKQLREALAARHGRPWRHTQEANGNGYNCFHLVVEVYGAAGLDVDRLRKFRGGSLNWGKFHPDSQILSFLLSDPECRRRGRLIYPPDPMMAGDLVVIRQGISDSHLAIAESDRVAWHIPRGGSVGRISVQVIEPQIHTFFRIHD